VRSKPPAGDIAPRVVGANAGAGGGGGILPANNVANFSTWPAGRNRGARIPDHGVWSDRALVDQADDVGFRQRAVPDTCLVEIPDSSDASGMTKLPTRWRRD